MKSSKVIHSVILSAVISSLALANAGVTPVSATPAPINLLPPAQMDPVEAIPKSLPVQAPENLTIQHTHASANRDDSKGQDKSEITASDRQIDCIASAIHHEARGEPIEGKIAVAEVILERVKSRKFRSTPCAVVAQRSQFSFVRRGNIPSVPSGNLKAMRRIALQVVNGEVSSQVQGALYFHATNVRPAWKAKLKGRIGQHIFYR